MQAPSLRFSGAERWLGLLVLGGGLLPAAAAYAQGAAPLAAPPLATVAAPLVFRGVTVIDVRDGQRLPNQTVTIVDRRIQTIAPSNDVRMPKGARVVDARGKYLIPGLWDMHVHPHEYVDLAFPLFVANGVTGVRDAGSEVPLAALVQWKREIAAGTRVGPRYLVSGPALEEGGPTQTAIIPNTDHGWQMYVTVPRALARYVVDSLHAGGADFLKLYTLSRAMYLEMAAEARRVGIRFGGHQYDNDGREASDSGATFLDHGTWLQPDVCGEGTDSSLAACTAAAQQLRRNNTWVTVLAQGLGFGDNLTGQSSAAAEARRRARWRRYLPASWGMQKADTAATAAERVGWREPAVAADFAADSIPFTLWHRAGLPVVVGTDMNLLPLDANGSLYMNLTPGFVVHEALVGFVRRYGLTPLEALQTATLNPALALRATDSLGTVAAGKLADLVLLDADPLADVWNTTKIRAVVANGRYYDRAALDQLLVVAAQVAAHR